MHCHEQDVNSNLWFSRSLLQYVDGLTQARIDSRRYTKCTVNGAAHLQSVNKTKSK